MAFMHVGIFARRDLAVFLKTGVLSGHNIPGAHVGGDAIIGDNHVEACCCADH